MGPEETQEIKSEPLEECFKTFEVKVEQDLEYTDHSTTYDSDPEKQLKRKRSAERYPCPTYSKVSDRPSKAADMGPEETPEIKSEPLEEGFKTFEVKVEQDSESTDDSTTYESDPGKRLKRKRSAERYPCPTYSKVSDRPSKAADMGPEETPEIKSEPLEESFKIVEVKVEQDSESTDGSTTSDSDPEKQAKRKRSAERYPCPTYSKVSDRPSKSSSMVETTVDDASLSESFAAYPSCSSTPGPSAQQALQPDHVTATVPTPQPGQAPRGTKRNRNLVSQYEAIAAVMERKKAERAEERAAARAEILQTMRPHAAYFEHFERFMDTLSPADVNRYKLELESTTVRFRVKLADEAAEKT